MKRIRVVKALGGRELMEIFVGNRREMISLRKKLKNKLGFPEKLFTSHKGDRKIEEATPESLLAIVIDKENKIFPNNFKVLDAKELEILGEKILSDNWLIPRLSGESKVPDWRRRCKK